MALENTKLDVVNETPKKVLKIDNDALEKVFGKPDSHESRAEDLEMNHNNKLNDNSLGTANSLSPLLEPQKDKQKPPLADHEVNHLEGDPPTNGHAGGTYPGIDDGLLDTLGNKPHILDIDGDDLGDDKTEPETGEDGIGMDDGKLPWMGGDEPDYPYDLEARFGADGRPISPAPTTVDVNTYQQKKTVAQGMMDLALLSANANQLRYVLESATSHPYYYPSLTFISLSIVFQIAVGVGLIINSHYDVNDTKEKGGLCKANKINDFTVLGIFLITIVNVFITSFSVAAPTVTVQAGESVIQQAG